MYPYLWAGWFAVLVVLEALAVYRRIPGNTLSEVTRSIITLTPGIRRTTLAGWAVFAAWFAWHIWG